jgi:hypothetical protein
VDCWRIKNGVVRACEMEMVGMDDGQCYGS